MIVAETVISDQRLVLAFVVVVVAVAVVAAVDAVLRAVVVVVVTLLLGLTSPDGVDVTRLVLKGGSEGAGARRAVWSGSDDVGVERVGDPPSNSVDARVGCGVEWASVFIVKGVGQLR